MPRWKEVSIEDLLPRDEISIDLKSVADTLHGKCILVTGSAGSIGSEIVKQLCQFNPRELVLIDSAETPQHNIRLMMAKRYPHIKAETIVTSITGQLRMENIFCRFRPDYVFHAAAYKHVPMMENNPTESVENNIYGTKRACRHGCEVRREEVCDDFHGQGGKPHQRHGMLEAHLRDVRAEP